jgi:hypothetical protein
LDYRILDAALVDEAAQGDRVVGNTAEFDLAYFPMASTLSIEVVAIRCRIEDPSARSAELCG